ncbi:MAG TPA: ABC transporter ATP-binding protein [Firmicutes bacterium]|nr:ABC transporter ATP-binding protein [Bacillota bacterium]
MEIVLEGISKHFGETAALDRVGLQVHHGELLTLLGPSGCGKTTLLRIVAGLETPDTGAVRFDGEEVTGWPPERRRVGLVFQNYALFPHMNVYQNIAYGWRDRRKARTRVGELLRLVGLPGYERRWPAELSAGEQQRVAIARALAPEPRALLLDEPLSALDARLRERLRTEIRRLQQQLGITMVYVTHDQAEALSISDRVAVMNAGRLEQVGTPREIYERPATIFVATFVGDANFFSDETDPDRVYLVRPENLVLEEIDAPGSPSGTTPGQPPDLSQNRVPGPPLHLLLSGRLVATVAGCEYMGPFSRVALDWQGVILFSLLPGNRELVPGRVVRLLAAEHVVVELADRSASTPAPLFSATGRLLENFGAARTPSEDFCTTAGPSEGNTAPAAN